jgi:penicillin amidase
MGKMRRWGGRVAVLAALLPVLAAGGVYVLLRQTVPPLSGTLAVAALSGPADIVRDREGVAHIFAGAVEDAYAALGFAHAQDRLWQMELLRLIAQGRLAEVFGPAMVDTDLFLRSLDLNGHAERSTRALSARSVALLEAYARGVNAFMERRTQPFEPRFAPEFLLLWRTPEPWRVADSVGVMKVMALMLSKNLEEEVRRLALAAEGLTPAEIADLMPLPADENPPPLPDLAQLYPLRRLALGPSSQGPASAGAASVAFLDHLGDGAGSNSWVVAGARSKSGAPLLANDPHLRLSAPSLWYLAHLSVTAPDVAPTVLVGASLPGTPLVLLGRTDVIAWGFTNNGADVQDLFIEKVNPDNPNEYLTPQGWRPFETEEVRVAVKGGEPVTFTRRRTRHGPVLPASWRQLGRRLGEGYVAALQWTGTSDDDTTIEAGLYDVRVRGVRAFFDKVRPSVVPLQNMIVADGSGKIGFIAPGRVPVRDAANRIAGRAPVPGWDDVYDWKGYLPFDALPRLEDPPEGAIGTANARVGGPDYPHHLTFDWEPAYRQQRIRELVLDRSGHDSGSMRAAQADVFSPACARLKPLMIAAVRQHGGANSAILDRLAAWDATMRAEAVEPLIFVAWLREAMQAIYSDDLGPVFYQFFDFQAPALERLLEGRAQGREWCDDRTTPEREDCGVVLARALDAALADLQRRYGADPGQWQWGRAHFANGEHRPLGMLAVIGKFFNVEVASPGDAYTLNHGKPEIREEPPYANRLAPSYRAIYDFADLDRSLYIQSTGQSGNPFSPFYRSFAERWAAAEYIRIPTQREAIEALGTWRLTPR